MSQSIRANTITQWNAANRYTRRASGHFSAECSHSATASKAIRGLSGSPMDAVDGDTHYRNIYRHEHAILEQILCEMAMRRALVIMLRLSSGACEPRLTHRHTKFRHVCRVLRCRRPAVVALCADTLDLHDWASVRRTELMHLQILPACGTRSLADRVGVDAHCVGLLAPEQVLSPALMRGCRENQRALRPRPSSTEQGILP